MAAPLAQLEVLRGTQRLTERGVLYGALVGMAVGVAWGSTTEDAPSSCEFLCPSRGTNMFWSGFLLSAVGAVGGAIIGARFQTEQWEPVFLTATGELDGPTITMGIRLRR
ncbi:MAG: hypothetical protein JNJ98_10550 [Gemmatimonadetes bacterium]|nr:hypothetical protein [Gemmatimonadota bacterium]